MASADCVTSIGAWSYATPTKNGASDCVTRAGINSAAARVVWAGNTGPRAKVDWLPPPTVPLDREGKILMNPVWYRAMFELFERRAGGINGASIPQVQTDVVNTQAEVAATTTFAAQVNLYAQGVAAVAEALKEVAVDEGLSGAESVPEAPERVPAYERKGRLD
jgi:hypothetical protein